MTMAVDEVWCEVCISVESISQEKPEVAGVV
jgi:hypothetical protein